MSESFGRGSTVRAAASRPTVVGIAVTDLSAAFGALVWVAAVLVAGLGPVERALTLAPLVLVPLGVGMAATPPFGGTAGYAVRAAVWLQPVGAVLFTASLARPVGEVTATALAAPWLLVTGLLGLAAVARTRARGGLALPEAAVDAGLAYVSVGAVALLLYQLDLTFWFGRTIVLLTAVHFHYAGFVLPVLVGLSGRVLSPLSGAFSSLAGVILVGPAIIAVGISFSPLVEVVAVGGFTVAVALFGGYVLARVAPARPRVQGLLLGASAIALPASMVLALGYGVATFSGTDLGLDIATMVALHGSLNAFGFALLGLVGWRLAVPAGVA
ncbi:YndJ family protein [Halomicroarcula sp. S1AR25-4]|uniref:YndJ family protein n=1 Tax=Haloarcula sp. S1AR25-4 TaxID=2950538 RepID=UPI0028756991|nr:YndJ family protein [Halomicroarcula sp. S1AR25-4]MDS0278932.1 YndJ family protein [Halomicroarcula sp. S1AR25-4]